MKRETTLFICTAWALILVGVLMVYSATGAQSVGIFQRHLVYLGVGVVAMYCAARFDYHHFANAGIFRAMLLGTLLLLLLVLIPGVGVEVDGGRRWLNLGFFRFQPSELAKFTLIVYLAVKFSQEHVDIKKLWKGLVPPLLFPGLLVVLVFLQKDMGIPVVMMLLTGVMLVVAGAKIWHLAFFGILAAPLVPLMVYLEPYRVARLFAFLNPFEYRQDAGWQLIQSLSAFAQGGVWGRGAGAGEQKLGYLPAAHTDFIFALVGEEFGLVGTVTVVSLFVVLLLAGLRIAMYAQDRFGGLLAAGIVSLLIIQAAFIMAVTTGLLPTKGLPLPFVSYGGTALIVAMALCGVMMNIGVQAKAPKKSHLRQRIARAGA